MDIGCAICQESFTANGECDATRCGHVFHKTCIAAWIQHSRTCPTCRAPTQRIQFTRIYFTTNMSDQAFETDELLRKLASAGEREAKLQAELAASGQIQATLHAELAAAGERESHLNSLVEKLQTDVAMGRSVETSKGRTIVTTVKAQLMQTANGPRIVLQGPDLSKVPQKQMAAVYQKANLYLMIEKRTGPMQIHIMCHQQPSPSLEPAVATKEAQLRSEVSKLQAELKTASQTETRLNSEVEKLRAEKGAAAGERETRLKSVVEKLQKLRSAAMTMGQRKDQLKTLLKIGRQREAKLQVQVANLKADVAELRRVRQPPPISQILSGASHILNGVLGQIGYYDPYNRYY